MNKKLIILVKIRTFLKQISFIRSLVIFTRIYKNKYGIIKKTKLIFYFLVDYLKYKRIKTNPCYSLSTRDLFPRIFDKTEKTHVGAVYFYQDSWCAKKVFETKPAEHYDVGSKAEMVGILSQFTPTVMIDIRPISLSLPNLSFIKGDILHLPFKTGSIKSLSSICVIEHIGLGRYGDKLNQFGSEEAAKELVRVLAHGGSLYISVPIDAKNKIYFNAHRAFTRDYVLQLFKMLKIVEEKYIYGDNMCDTYDAKKGFGTGLYHFSKD